MSQDPWNSYKMLMEIRNRMNKLLMDGCSQFDSTTTMQSSSSWSPPFDLVETDKDFVIYGELPGITKSQVEIKLQGNDVLISGERKSSPPDGTNSYHLAERYYGDFQRTFRLPSEINDKDIKTSLTNGLLEIKLPKKKERTIKIK